MIAKDHRSKTKDQTAIDWDRVKRVLVIRLRSIGDTVLATPSLIALKRFLPHAEIDILLENWVAPLIEGHDAVDNVIHGLVHKHAERHACTCPACLSRRFIIGRGEPANR